MLNFEDFLTQYFSKYKFRYDVNIEMSEKIFYLFGIYYDESDIINKSDKQINLEKSLMGIFYEIFRLINDGDFEYGKLDSSNNPGISEFEFNVFVNNCIYCIMDYFGNLKEIEKDRLYVCLEYDIIFMPVIECNDMFTGEYENNIFNNHMKILGLKEIHSKLFCGLK